MFFKLLKDWNGQKPGATLSMSEGDGDVLVKGGVAEPVQDDPLGPIITRGLEDALGTFTRNLDQIIMATLQKYAQTLTLSPKNGAPVLFGPEGRDVKGKSAAEQRLDQSLKARRVQGDHSYATDALFLAMALQWLGHGAEAKQWLKRAVQVIEWAERDKLKVGTPVSGQETRYNRLVLQRVREEAEALVK